MGVGREVRTAPVGPVVEGSFKFCRFVAVKSWLQPIAKVFYYL